MSVIYICFLTPNKCISTADSVCAYLWWLRFLCCYLSCSRFFLPFTYLTEGENELDLKALDYIIMPYPSIINSFVLFICSLIHSRAHPFIHPPTHLRIHLPKDWLICLFLHPSIHSPVHSSTNHLFGT